MKLSQLQRTHGARGDAAAHSFRSHAAPRSRRRLDEGTLRDFIKPNDRLTSFERLEIYNRHYWFRVLSAF